MLADSWPGSYVDTGCWLHGLYKAQAADSSGRLNWGAHDNGANFVFLDTHAAWLKRGGPNPYDLWKDSNQP